MATILVVTLMKLNLTKLVPLAIPVGLFADGLIVYTLVNK